MHGASRLVLVLILLVGSHTACKKPVLETSRTAYVIGPTRDIVPLNRGMEARLAPDVVNASVLLATRITEKRIKFCSGTLVMPEVPGGNYRVLSNHHCFAKTDADDQSTPELVPEACVQTKAYFGFLPGQTRSAVVSGCLPGSLRTNFEGDLAVFTLTVNPPIKHQPLALYGAADHGAGRRALIVHYPDVTAFLELPPDGGTRLPTAAATVDDCQVVGEFDVGEWTLDRTLPYSIRHTCDLIHGSSGSALIDVETGTILGVNWGGIKVNYDDTVRTDNVATKASYVNAFLSNQLAAEVAAAATRQQADTVAANKAVQVERKSPAATHSPKIFGCGAIASQSERAVAALGWCWFVVVLPMFAYFVPSRQTLMILNRSPKSCHKTN